MGITPKKRTCPKMSYKKSFQKKTSAQSKQKKFVTHDNGARPFTVKIWKDHVTVEWKIGSKTHTKRFETSKVFIGKSYKNAMTEFSCGYGKHFDGNSILIKVPGGHGNTHKYVYIGNSVKSFEALDDIQAYYSPVGNSNVPYPFAVSKKVNGKRKVYLMIENVIIDYDFDKNDPKKNDPYTWYYDHAIIVDNSKTYRESPKTGKLPKKGSNFQGIADYFVEENGEKDHYTLRYNPFPNHQKGQHAFIVKNSKTLSFSLEDKRKLFSDYGEEMGFTPLPMETLVERQF